MHIETDETVDLELGLMRGWNASDVSERRPAGRIRADHVRAQRDVLNFDVLNTYDLATTSPYRQLMMNMDDPPQFKNVALGGRGQWGVKG